MREDILQLILQYLNQNNPEISEKIPFQLEDKFSGQKLKAAVLSGQWDEILNRLEGRPGLELPRFKIIEQKIQEVLGRGNQKEAFEILRNDLSPLNVLPDRIHKLAQNILLLKADAKDRNVLAQELFVDLKRVPGLMITEDRLEELVGQAVKYQQMKCPYHFGNQNNANDSIWYDHKCPADGPIILYPEDVNRKRIVVPDRCSGDLFTLLTTPDYSRLIVVNEDGKASIFYRDSSTATTAAAMWTATCEATSIGHSKPLTIWPKFLERMPIVHVLLNMDNYEQVPIILEPILLENMMAIAFMSYGEQDYAVISTEDQWTVFYDTRANRVIHSWTRLRCSHLLTPTDPDEKYFLAISDNGNVLQISTETFEVIKTIATMDEKLQVSSAYLDGNRLLLGYSNSTVYYYDDWKRYGQPTRIFRGHQCTKYRANSILSRYDDNIVVSCSENGSIYVWNIETGRLVYEIKLQEEGVPINDIIETDTGTFVTCGDNNELYEWSLK